MSISRKEMLMSLAQSSEKGYKMRQGSDMARFNESFMDTIKSVGKAAYDTGKYMVTGELPGAHGSGPLPSKEEQRKQQDATQTGFGGLEKTINAAETGAKVAKGINDVGMQLAMPGVGGAIATGIDLASAGAAHAMGQSDARDYALKSAGANAVGAGAGAVAKVVTNVAAKSAPAIANVVGGMAKEGTKQALNAATTENKNKPKVAMEAYNAKRLSVILETISALVEGSKPDFLDFDKDGNKKEPMKKAIKDRKRK